MEQNILLWLQKVAELLPWVGLIGLAAVLIFLLIRFTLYVLDLLRQFKQKAVFVELTPPAFTDKTPHATKQFFSVLHGLTATQSLKDKALRRTISLSLEVLSSREAGIRYIARLAKSDLGVFKQSVLAYLPDVRFSEAKGFILGKAQRSNARVIEFKQTGHFAYPLHIEEDSLAQHDAIAYLTEMMTELEPDEVVAFQLVVSPTRTAEADRIGRKILHNEELVHSLGRSKGVLSSVFDVINSLLFGILDMIGEISSPTHPTYHKDNRKYEVAAKIRPARTLTQLEQQLASSIHHKVNQPLFKVSVRALVLTDDKQSRLQRVKRIKASLSAFNVPKYQSLKALKNFPQQLVGKYRLFVFNKRLPALFTAKSCILSASEIADLYHFPHSETTKTENIVKSLSKSLPAPISLKGAAGFDLVLGKNTHHGHTTSIGLTTAERERHVYIIGGTGNGKTTLLQYAIVQDIKNGKGVAVVDPHGDLAADLLGYIPKSRINDVVYFNPDDLDYPFGLNLLELPAGLSDNDLLREKDRVTESVISVFRKIFSDSDEGGHRIEYVLRNAIQTALTVESATLFTVYDLLNNPTYRNKIVKGLENPDLVNFWKNEMGKAGDFQRVKMVAGITAKVGRFLFSASAKRVLEQPKSTIDFDDIINSGKILICNFSKGQLGEDTSELFGIAVLAKLQLAAYRRTRIKPAERRPFYLYVDEFQNFATQSFVQMLSEARKYKLFLLMAEQSTSQQQEQRMVNIVLANVGTVICFRSGNPADEKLLLPLFAPYVEPGEIASLPPFNFYVRLAATKSQEPLSGETIVLTEPADESMANKAVKASRKNYGKKHVRPTKPKKEPDNDSSPQPDSPNMPEQA